MSEQAGEIEVGLEEQSGFEYSAQLGGVLYGVIWHGFLQRRAQLRVFQYSPAAMLARRLDTATLRLKCDVLLGVHRPSEAGAGQLRRIRIVS